MQCGNPDCPELANRDNALRALEAAKQQREREQEEARQKMVIKQIRIDAKRQRFAKKHFRKRPVPRFEEMFADGDLEELASEVEKQRREVEEGEDAEIETGTRSLLEEEV